MVTAARYLATAALSAAAVYWLDRTSGRRRRARLRDRLASFGTRLGDAAGVGGRDLAHRFDGLVARAATLVRPDRGVTDEVLAERVRAMLGRAVSHPGAIEVAASDGRVVLNGAVLAWENEQLLRLARSVRGVEHVESRLAVHESASGIPALQGGRPRLPPRFELLQENWSPAARLLTGGTGSALVWYAVRHRNLAGLLAAAAGGLLLARSTTNAPLKRLAGASGRSAVDIRKTLHVQAPLERVFETLAHYENYPIFMRNVRKVQMHGDGRSRWTVAGPAGVPVHWDAETTAREPNRLLAWRTLSGSAVAHTGAIRFEPFNGGTRLTIRMSYSPPAGALGHLVARLFGRDPKTELDEDLVRLKSYLETGKPPRDAAGHGAAHAAALGAARAPRQTGAASPSQGLAAEAPQPPLTGAAGTPIA